MFLLLFRSLNVEMKFQHHVNIRDTALSNVMDIKP